MRVIALACVLAIALPARADDKADAQRLYSEGQTKYRAGDFAGAADSFRAAYEHDKDPVYLFNIAQAYRFAKACGSSAEYYRKFLAAAPNAPNRDKVTELLQEMDACAKSQSLDLPAAASQQSIEPKPAPVDSSEPGASKRYAGIALGAVGLTSFAIGLHFLSRLLAVEKQRDDMCGPPKDPCAYDPTLADFDARGHKFARDEWISYSIGAAAVTGGIVLYMFGRADSGERAVAVTPTRNGIAISGKF